MKKIIIILISILLCNFYANATVDSIYWNKQVSPQTLYVKGQIGLADKFTKVEQNLVINDTLVVDLIFEHCDGPASSKDWDSLISLSATVNLPYLCLKIREVLDTNTVKLGCPVYPNRLYNVILIDCNAPLSISQSTFNNTLTLSPNPVQNILTLQSQEPMEQVSIYNMYGVLVQKQTYSEHINVAALRSGVYVLEARGKHGVWRSKFQKE